MKYLGYINQGLNQLVNNHPAIFILRITLLLLILHGASTWSLAVPLRILCGLMLISDSLLRNKNLWLLLSISVFLMNAIEWFWIDNHKYLISYWCFACTFAISSKKTETVLQKNATLLVGLTFFFATVWKIIGGGYFDGSFLHYTALTDSRIEGMAGVFGGLKQNALHQNRILESTLKLFPDKGIKIELVSTNQLKLVSLVSSYWTLLIESAIAITFLVSGSPFIKKVRNYILITFIISTYFILPVTGFAFILTVLGLSQCDLKSQSIRKMYIILFILIQLTLIPLNEMISNYL